MPGSSAKERLLAQLGALPIGPRFNPGALQSRELLEWQRQFDSWWEELRGVIEDLKSRVSTNAGGASADLVALQLSLASLQESLSALDDRVDASEDDITTIQSALSSLADQISSILSTGSGLEDRVEVLEDSDHYHHEQGTPADTWVINHNLGRTPGISTFTSTGKRFFGAEQRIDDNTTHILTNGAIDGWADCY